MGNSQARAPAAANSRMASEAAAANLRGPELLEE